MRALAALAAATRAAPSEPREQHRRAEGPAGSAGRRPSPPENAVQTSGTEGIPLMMRDLVRQRAARLRDSGRSSALLRDRRGIGGYKNENGRRGGGLAWQLF